MAMNINPNEYLDIINDDTVDFLDKKNTIKNKVAKVNFGITVEAMLKATPDNYGRGQGLYNDTKNLALPLLIKGDWGAQVNSFLLGFAQALFDHSDGGSGVVNDIIFTQYGAVSLNHSELLRQILDLDEEYNFSEKSYKAYINQFIENRKTGLAINFARDIEKEILNSALDVDEAKIFAKDFLNTYIKMYMSTGNADYKLFSDLLIYFNKKLVVKNLRFNFGSQADMSVLNQIVLGICEISYLGNPKYDFIDIGQGVSPKDYQAFIIDLKDLDIEVSSNKFIYLDIPAKALSDISQVNQIKQFTVYVDGVIMDE